MAAFLLKQQAVCCFFAERLAKNRSIFVQGARVISTSISGALRDNAINKQRLLLNKRLQKSLRRKNTRKRLIRYGLVTANMLVLGVVALLVVAGSHSDSTLSASKAVSTNTATNPVDGLTAYDIAANVARMVNLPESTAINNQAQSAQVAVAVSASDTSVGTKPQIVATALKSKDDIQTYVAQAGDTVTSIAQKFGITSDSIRWSNNLTGDAVSLGTKLAIPPINGVVYNVKTGDTVDSLATKFSANAAQIVAYNNAEISGITAGEQVLIPNGQVQKVGVSRGGGTAGVGVTGLSVSNYTPIYGNNGYAYGYCTWYVASRIQVPNNWGNANTWAYYAALSGWTVSAAPSVGAIAQTSAGYAGHVAIVTSVNDDGTVTISEMNATAGWGKVDSRTLSASSFQHYITH